MTRRDSIEREREIARIVDARMAKSKHEIAVHIAICAALVGVLLISAALSGVPVFTAKMAWGVIIIAVLDALYNLW